MTPGLRAAIVIAVLLVMSSAVLFVQPGYGLFIVGDVWFGHRFAPIRGDQWLPTVMQVQILWAPAVPLAYVLVRRAVYAPAGSHARHPVRAAVAYALLLYAWAVALATLFHGLAA